MRRSRVALRAFHPDDPPGAAQYLLALDEAPHPLQRVLLLHLESKAREGAADGGVHSDRT